MQPRAPALRMTSTPPAPTASTWPGSWYGGPSRPRRPKPDHGEQRADTGCAPCPPFAATTSSVLVEQHAAHVLAVQQVLVTLVDLIQRVFAGHQLVQLQAASPVQVQHAGDLVEGVAAAEQRSLDLLLEQGEEEARKLDIDLVRPREPGHYHAAVLADGIERGPDDVLGAHAAGQYRDELLRLACAGGHVSGAEALGRLPLVRQWIDGDHMLSTREGCALHGVDADS